MVNLFESFYENDGETAYIMTADHGMSDWGSHGSGHPDETLTPIVAWGAGVHRPVEVYSKDGGTNDSLSHDWQLDKLRRSDVSQIDIAALMSTLVGKVIILVIASHCFNINQILLSNQLKY